MTTAGDTSHLRVADATPMQCLTGWAQATDFDSDVDVLNYALTLEDLKAEFYRQGNSAGLVSGKEMRYLDAVQADEDSHVATITATVKPLGGQPVAAPAVVFGESLASRESYLTISHVFENTGVQAYLSHHPAPAGARGAACARTTMRWVWSHSGSQAKRVRTRASGSVGWRVTCRT